MRRLWTIALTAALLIASVAVAEPTAAAATPPTINGPSSAPYWANVNVSGTAAPGSTVQLYVQRTGDKQFGAGHHTTAVGDGEYAFTLRIVRTSRYYVTADSAQSPTVETSQYTATCSVGGPIVTHLLLPPTHTHSTAVQNFVEFSVSRSATWAGVAGNTDTFAVFVRRPGDSAKVLHRFDYSGVEREAFNNPSVNVAGITAQGAVVAAAQNHGTNIGDQRYSSYIWKSGVAHRLAALPGWVSERATGVADDGQIFGWARKHVAGGPSPYLIVEWNADGSVVRALSSGDREPPTLVDGNGDVAYLDQRGYTQALSPAGNEHELRDSPLDVPRGESRYIAFPFLGQVTGQDTFFGETRLGVERWNVPVDSSDEPIVGTTVSAHNAVFAANDPGDLIVGEGDPSELHTAAGAVVALPGQANADHRGGPTTVALSAAGTAAFTSAKDDLPHLFRCSTNK